MISEKAIERERGNKYTTTLRIHRRVYAELDRLKELYCKQNDLPRMSFTDLLMECCKIGTLLLNGEELYAADGKLYQDIETARGAAIQASVKTGRPAEAPVIMLRLGRDALLK